MRKRAPSSISRIGPVTERRLIARLPLRSQMGAPLRAGFQLCVPAGSTVRSEEHTSELQSLRHLVCRLLLEKNTELPAVRLAVSHIAIDHVPTSAALAS